MEIDFHCIYTSYAEEIKLHKNILRGKKKKIWFDKYTFSNHKHAKDKIQVLDKE